MPDSERTAKQILGLISLALVPFGVFAYIYSSQVSSDVGSLPNDVVGVLAAPVGYLDIITAISASTTFFGMVFLLLYVIDYVKNPDVYADSYSRKSALFGIFGGLVWIVVVTAYGYLPASSSVIELAAAAQNGATTGNLASYVSSYERSVFRMSISGGAVVLGLVWWLISLVSWVEAPESTAQALTLDGEPYCGSCGSRLPGEDSKQCPECGMRLR